MRFKSNLMDDKQLRRTVIRIACEITEGNRGADRLIAVGLGKRGFPLACEIAKVIETVESIKVPVIAMDDNPVERMEIKESDAPLSNGKCVVIIDDVLYTGRTVRAAMEAVVKALKPDTVRLAVLVDRGGRELPLGADYVGLKIKKKKNELISVSLKSVDGEDRIDLYTTDD